MKTVIKCNKIPAFATLIFLLATLTAYSQNRKVKFDISELEPAAEGNVKIDKDKNGNYKIDLDVIHLSGPERLTPPKAAYVVWMETAHNGTQNLGQLKSTEGPLLRTLKGSLSAVTPYQPVSFFVTAEDQANVTTPGQTVVLKTQRVD